MWAQVILSLIGTLLNCSIFGPENIFVRVKRHHYYLASDFAKMTETEKARAQLPSGPSQRKYATQRREVRPRFVVRAVAVAWSGSQCGQ